jgi:hypothetical protein
MIERLLEAERALSMGRLDQAERLYRQAWNADPRNSIAVVGLARVALERGDERGAQAMARRALEIDEDNQAARRLLDRLLEVRATRAGGPPEPRPERAAEPRPERAPERAAEPRPERAPEPPPAPTVRKPAPPSPQRPADVPAAGPPAARVATPASVAPPPEPPPIRAEPPRVQPAPALPQPAATKPTPPAPTATDAAATASAARARRPHVAPPSTIRTSSSGKRAATPPPAPGLTLPKAPPLVPPKPKSAPEPARTAASQPSKPAQRRPASSSTAGRPGPRKERGLLDRLFRPRR